MPDPTKTEVRRASAHVFELLMDWFPDVIHSVDAEGNIIYANRRASELLGYTRDELLTMNISQLYAPEVLTNVRRGFRSLKEDGNLRVVESMLQDKKGTRIPVEIRSFAVYDHEGSFVRTFSILRDTREIRELQDSLIHASRLAALGELAACVAHDISNPLAVIKLYTELLTLQLQQLSAGVDAEERSGLAESVVSVQKSADRIERLVNHLRGFCRNAEAEARAVDLATVVDDALFMVTNKVQKSGINVTRDFPQDRHAYVRGHANQLEQVIMNLASNACDAMSTTPKRELRITIRSLNDPGKSPMVRCEIADTGVGMTPEVKRQVFTSFFTTKPQGQGTGLGLAIARNIVRRHNGEISVDSEEGKGTAFTILLPAFEAGPQSQQEGKADATRR